MRLAAAAFIAMLAGCDGVQPIILPFGQVTAVQLFEETNYTVALSVESAVANPDSIARVNWVFGDGSGFVEGPADRATMTHRYPAPGQYPVTAYVFGSAGLVDQIDTTIDVVENDQNGPAPQPNPEDFPGLISAPFPAGDATEVAVDVEIRWTSGILTDSFDVYFGTSESDVENADTGDADIFQGNQTESKFTPGDLDPEKTYFWRVDGVNDLGETKGVVRKFTTARLPGAAKSPVPSNGSTSARVDVVLKWTSGARASSHNVYFGKNESDVENATEDDDSIFAGKLSDSEFDPSDEDAERDGELLPETNYFWRIDEIGTGGTVKGGVWKFKTSSRPPKIAAATPADGQTGVNIEQVLSWTASPSVEQFDVYIGTDPVGVDEADRQSPEFQNGIFVTTFDPETLLGATKYYWRVDTIGAGGTTKGDVLSFTTIAPPGAASAPFEPADGATNVDINPELKWAVGGGGPTTNFTVFLSKNQLSVVNGETSARRAVQDVAFTTFKVVEASALEPDTQYFWRIEASGPGGITTGSVQSFTTGSEPAAVTGPDPSNSAKGVALDKLLSWAAASGANKYDVYLGTVQADVDSATGDDAEFQATVVATNFQPAELLGNTQYFWRVDARGPGGRTKGPLWRFMTSPVRATVPSPIIGATEVALDASLSWTAGAGASSHDVYLGTDMAMVLAADTSTAGIFRGNQPGTTYTPPSDLDGATSYYWRIDEVNSDGTTKGLLWSFSTGAGQAAEPINPANGAIGVELLPTLSWTAGDGAVMHDIYLGKSLGVLDNANHGSAEFIGTQALGNESYTPGTELDANTVYYWRIDEIAADNTLTKGVLWQFRTLTGKATDPRPMDDDLGIDVNADLSWSMGDGATSSQVYLGTNEMDVTNATIATAGIFRATVMATTYEPNELMPNTTYYWRIDSVGSGGTSKGDIWAFTTGAGLATSPAPANGATGVSLLPTLTWTPGAGTDSYDIYFGPSMAGVENATESSPEYEGNFPSAGGAMFQPSIVLSGQTFYFWRIDSVTADGVTKGKVWSFRTAPGLASSPMPGNFETGVAVGTTLTWNPGVGAAMSEVYFGTSESDVSGSSVGNLLGGTTMTSTPAAVISPGSLTAGTVYYWRVDSVAANGTTRTKGLIWRFTTQAVSLPAQAGSPSPFNGATNIAINTALSWGAADRADSYDVYFGTSMAAVGAASTLSPEFQGNQSIRSYSPAGLANNTTYYWRIDSVNSQGKKTGAVWSFTTVP